MKKLFKVIASPILSICLTAGVFASDLEDIYKHYEPIDYEVQMGAESLGCFRGIHIPTAITVKEEESRDRITLKKNVTRGELLNFISHEFPTTLNLHLYLDKISTSEASRMNFSIENFIEMGVINNNKDLYLNRNINFAEFSKIIIKVFFSRMVQDSNSPEWWENYVLKMKHLHLNTFQGTHIMTNEDIVLIFHQMLHGKCIQIDSNEK